MDIMEQTRALCRELQSDGRYVRCRASQRAVDDNVELQNLVGEFNLQRLALNNEISKDDADAAKVGELNTAIRELYTKIMNFDCMTEYNQAKGELDELIADISSVIAQCADGADPDTVEPASGCGGSCDSCAGCG